jgi:hypothetical protein
MATLAYQTVKTTGITPTFAAADAAGDKVLPNDRGLFYVKNGGTAAVTLTIATPGNTKYGAAIPDITVSVAAGAEGVIGPFPADLVGSDGYVDIAYSAVTSVTRAALTV